MIIEVFKTNVRHHEQAKMLSIVIHYTFKAFTANFDLEDCDRILRVKSENEPIEPPCIIELLNDLGFEATVLPDDVYVMDHY